jgi:hypothetical protein
VAGAVGPNPTVNVSTPAPSKPNPAEADTKTIEGPEVSVTADWNDHKNGTGLYTAPEGWKILQILVHEISNANGGTYRTEIAGNQARVIVSAHGSGKFYDQYRGWVHVKSSLILLHRLAGQPSTGRTIQNPVEWRAAYDP